MAYFSEFPTINYDIDKTGQPVRLRNILKGIRVRDELKENAALYIRYDYKDADRPEYIANRAYDDPELHWIILHMNDIINPYYDLPVSEIAMSRYVGQKYPGQAFFLNYDYSIASSSSSGSGFLPIAGSYREGERVRGESATYTGTAAGGSLNHIKLPTDALTSNDAYNGAYILFTAGTGSGQSAIISDYNGASRTATFETPIETHLSCDTEFEIYKTGLVYEWDATYSRLIVTDIYGTFAESERIIGITSGTTSILQRKVLQSKSAVHHFRDPDTGVWYDPRNGDIDYLAGYVMGTSNPVIESAVLTNEEHERIENDNKRFISLMDPDIVTLAISDFRSSIKG